MPHKMQRDLNKAERAIAESVFEDSLPFWRISISTYAFANDVTRTIPGLGSWLLTLGTLTFYTINIGPEKFTYGMQGPDDAGTLIHELTHVWQGVWADGFVIESLTHQAWAACFAKSRNAAYEYTPGAPWNSYNVEQQAEIVEDWYEKGRVEKDDDALFHYIRDVIRSPINPIGRMIPFEPYHR